MECWIVFVSIVVVAVALGVGQLIALNHAKQAYLESLGELRLDPHNPDLRETCLALGREYAKAARKMKGIALFDEVALMNDINAACARAGSRVTIEEDSRRPSVEDRLAKLEDLMSKGMISEQEYESRRQRILDEL